VLLLVLLGRIAVLHRCSFLSLMEYHDLSVMIVSCPKMAQPIEMPFGIWTWVGSRNHVLNGDSDPHAKGQF